MHQVVLVTGCSTGGIGYALCEEFARQGCKVYASSRRIETIADFGYPNIEKLSLDVTSDESVHKALSEIVDKEGKIDIVVNNAGVIAAGPLVEQPIDDVKQVFETNTFAILRVCQAVVPMMAKRHSGTIVNVGSIVGEVKQALTVLILARHHHSELALDSATPWNGVYCSSKAAVHSISEVLSMELKPLGISVVHVAPGAVKSNISANGTKRFQLAANTLYTDFLSNIIKRINASQGPNSMPSEEFAKQVVQKTLKKNPPRYLSIGGHSALFALFKWLPRTFVLGMLWKSYSK